MKLLIITGPLYPHPWNNANLIGKLIPYFLAAGHEVHIFTAAFGRDKRELPRECFGVPVHWVTDQKRDWKRKLLYPTIAKVSDPDGFSDALQVQILMRELKSVCEQFPFGAVLSTSEPYSMAYAASQLYGGKKVLYLMDPPARVSNGTETAYRNRVLPTLLRNQTALITTPFIHNALKSYGYRLPRSVEDVGFPMITDNHMETQTRNNGKTRLLFCGWLYSDIRSPQYFLDIVSRLDDRFEVTFMGRECESLREHFSIETKATLITLPNQPYDIALQAMADADVLINIGNSVPVHMPSKTLEYINTGKPMVNFYKLKDCPTLYYTKRYPLCLNLYEGEQDIEQVTKTFVDFCIAQKGELVDHNWIEREYKDCTPKNIAQKILDSLEK